MFSTKEEIHDLIKTANSDLFSADRNLMSDLKNLRNERNPFYLNEIEFERILNWKLRSQYHRQKLRRKMNTKELVRDITATAFKITHYNIDYEIELKINILRCIRGVEIPIASAVLALCFPESFAVIDFRNWEQLYNKKKQSFRISDYLIYLKDIKILADKFEFKIKDIDTAIWQKNKEQ